MSKREKVTALLVAGTLLAIVAVIVVVARSGGGDTIPTLVKEGNLSKPTQVLEQGEPATVEMKTTEGNFTIVLDTERASVTANNFAYLTEEGFYDGLGFHRIVPDFVIQGGDPLGDGTGDPGYKVVEAPPEDLKYDVGVVAMAKSGSEAAGTSGSQFYVVIGDSGLPPVYALVGRVSEGMDVVQKIGTFGDPASPEGEPSKEVVIQQATLEKG